MRLRSPSPFAPAALPRHSHTEPQPSGVHLRAWAASGLAVVSVTAPALAAEAPVEVPRAPVSLDELEEARLLGGKNRVGRLVQTHFAETARARIAVHGVNGSPADVAPLTELGPARGENTHAFAYDDRFRRLEHSADDLARVLVEWRTAHPETLLSIDAHSMGGRIAVAAVARMAATMDPGPIELNLIAVPLAGYESANWARLSPAPLRGLIPVTRPGLDMGTRSGFQRALDRVVLPESVRTTIYVAGRDEVVEGGDAHPLHVVRNLRARVVHLEHEDHVSVVAKVAELLQPGAP